MTTTQGIWWARQASLCRQRGLGRSGWTSPKVSPRREPPKKEIVEFPLALSFAVSFGRPKVGPEWPKSKTLRDNTIDRGPKTLPTNECPLLCESVVRIIRMVPGNKGEGEEAGEEGRGFRRVVRG